MTLIVRAGTTPSEALADALLSFAYGSLSIRDLAQNVQDFTPQDRMSALNLLITCKDVKVQDRDRLYRRADVELRTLPQMWKGTEIHSLLTNIVQTINEPHDFFDAATQPNNNTEALVVSEEETK